MIEAAASARRRMPLAFERILPHVPLILIWMATFADGTAYAALAILRHNALGSNALDLGYEDQTLWNTLHGRFYQFTLLTGGGFSLDFQAPLGQAATSLLGYHAELLLGPLALLYAVIPNVRAVLALQALVVCAGALVAFGLARRRLGSAWAAFFVAVAYLASPFVEAELLSDFHTVALDSALLLLLFYMVERRWLLPAIFLGLVAAAAKEDAPVAVMLVGGWAALVRRQRRLGGALFLVGATFAAFDFGWLIPHFAAAKASPFLSRYAYLGATPLAMLENVARQPTILRWTLLSPDSLAYLRALAGSSGGLPLAAPLALAIAGPSLAINLLADFPWMRSGMAHYSALVLPILIAASVDGIAAVASLLARLRNGRRPTSAPPRRITLALAAWLAVAALVTHYQLGAGPGGRWLTIPRPSAHDRLLPRFLAEIPPDAAVSATSALAPHLTHRAAVYLFPNVLDARYVLLDLTAAPYPLSWGDQRARLLALLQSGTFGVADAADGYVLLQRGGPTINLPPATFSFTQGPSAALAKRPVATFGDLELRDVTIRRSLVIGGGWQETLITDWTVRAALTDDAILAVWTDGVPRPIPPDFRDETPTLVWLPTSNWQPGQVTRVVTPPLAVKAPTALQIGWFTQDQSQDPVHWMPCREGNGGQCPLATHYVVRE